MSKIDEDIVDLAYERIAGAIPDGTTRAEALRASCRLVGDILAQGSSNGVDENLLRAAKGLIECEYKLFMEKA